MVSKIVHTIRPRAGQFGINKVEKQVCYDALVVAETQVEHYNRALELMKEMEDRGLLPQVHKFGSF